MKIKVCGLTVAANILSVMQCQPDYIGFIFYPGSKRYVGAAPDLKDAVSVIKNAVKVGVFVNAPVEEITVAVNGYQLDMIQLHGSESPADCRKAAMLKPVIKAFQMHDAYDFDELEAYEGICSHFLFDTASEQHGGTGKNFDWRLLDRYKLDTPFLLSGGITPGQAKAIKQVRHPALCGVDVNSRFEITPGIKNIEQLKTFIHEIRH